MLICIYTLIENRVMLVIQQHHLFFKHKYSLERDVECLFSRCDMSLLLKCVGSGYFASEREIEVASKLLYAHVALRVRAKSTALLKYDSL